MSEKANINKSLIIAAPLLTAIHVLGHFIAFIPLATVVLWAIKTGSLLRIIMVGLASIYIFPIVLLLCWSLMIRLVPRPHEGLLTKSRDIFLNIIHAGLGNFARMSASRQALAMLPFPGHLFYTIVSKGKIHPSVLISNPDCICDATLIEIGANSIIGQNSILSGHFQPTPKDTTIGRISIGKNVLIGGYAGVLPNVTIGDNSIVQAHAVVMSGTNIPANEVWGGMPARFIRKINSAKLEQNFNLNISKNNVRVQ